MSPIATQSPISTGIPRWLAYSGLGILFFALMMREIGVYDIWFLLLAGRYTLEHLAVPHHDFYLYTALNQPQLFGGWGFGLLAELARRTGGVAAVCYFNAMLWSGVFALGLCAVRASRTDLDHTRVSWAEIICLLLSTTVILLAIIVRTLIRPEVTVFLAWMVGLLLFEYGRKKNNFNSALVLYPLLLWAEAWLHTAGPVLILLPAAYGIEYFYHQRIVLRHSISAMRPELIAWAVSGFVMIVLPCFNPNGIAQVYTHLDFLLSQLHDLSQSNSNGTSPPLPGSSAFNVEYLPAWEFPQLQSVYITLSVVTALLLTSSRRLHTFCLIAPLAAFAILHNRGLGLWGLALLVPFTCMLLELWQAVFSKMQRTAQDTVAIFILPLCILGLFGLSLRSGLLKPASSTTPLSVAAEEIRGAYPEGGNVFTEQHLGALMAWNLGEKFKVGHGTHIMITHPEPPRHYAVVMQTLEGWENELARYNIIAVVAKADDLFFGDPHPLMRKIAYDRNWRLADVSPEALTYIRVKPGTARESDAERLTALQAFWEAVARDATKVKQGAAFARTKAAIALSAAKLAYIKANITTPSAALQKLTAEELLAPP